MHTVLSLLFTFILSLQAREVVDNIGACQINWSQGYITCEGESAEGQSKYAANISAKVIAQRNLLEVVQGVRIDSMVTVKDGMFSSDIIKSRVQGVIRGGQIVSNIYDTQDKYSVATIRLEMGKDLLAALLSDPKQLSWNEKVEKLWNQFHLMPTLHAATYSQHDKATLEKLLADLRKNGDKQASNYVTTILKDLDTVSYSGILIDVSDISNFKKAMIVKLVDEDGHEIYPSNLLDKATLLKRNTSVGYMYGFRDARNDKRVFSVPVEMKAKKVYKKRFSNIVLNQQQIDTIKTLDKEILKNAKIILVLGD